MSGTFSGEDVMVRQVEELLLLTCLGGFVAGITYALTAAPLRKQKQSA